MYWLGYLPGSMFREHVSGATFFVCTGWSTYPGACFESVFQEQAPSCVPALKVIKFDCDEAIASEQQQQDVIADFDLSPLDM